MLLSTREPLFFIHFVFFVRAENTNRPVDVTENKIYVIIYLYRCLFDNFGLSWIYTTHFNWGVHPCLYRSDHFPDIVSSEFPSTPKSVSKSWILDNAHWGVFQSALQLPSQFESPSLR